MYTAESDNFGIKTRRYLRERIGIALIIAQSHDLPALVVMGQEYKLFGQVALLLVNPLGQLIIRHLAVAGRYWIKG
jgi:hypothetical protein